MRGMVNVPRPSGAHRFQAPQMRFGRSQFDLTHSHKTTFDASYLYPYFLMEVVPGDTVTCRLDSLLRIFSPLDAPIMDDIRVEIDFFYTPNRILWGHFDDSLGAHDAAGAQDTSYITPRIADGTTIALGDMYQYMGVPIGLQTTVHGISALPSRAYRRIYNDWYRDQNLIAEVVVNDNDGPDDGSYATTLLKSAKKHDYFTSALPYLQKGTAVSITLSTTSAPVRMNDAGVAGLEPTVKSNTGASEYRLASSGAWVTRETTPTDAAELYADLSAVTAVSINALREAEAIQRLLERDARGGTRLPELIKAHFGVDVPDFRVQRPEYLGGGHGFINVSPVANTSATATEDQGQLVGVGTGRLRASWAKSFVEHGFVIGILRARGQITYQQGLDKMWTRGRVSKYDYLWPEFVNLGEQAIYNKEIFLEHDATDEAIFGYQERYADYRWKRSLVTGKFASDAAGSLDYWHLAEDFAATPTLGQTFIEDATPMSRVTTVDTEPDFIIDGRFDVKVARVLPVRPTPSLAPPRF